jgi:hypothetical protein
MYQADWTSLSAAVDVTEFDDYDVRHRIAESRRPSWAPTTGAGTGPGRQAGRGPAGRWAAAADEDEEDEDGPDEGDEEQPESGPVRETSYRLLIAPGGRFRQVGDGSPWETGPPPCDELLYPAWLPAMFELDLAGSGFIAGRRAHRVIGKPRPAGRGRARRGRSALRPAGRPLISGLESVDRVDAYVDAELGILLRSERLFRGQVAGRCEMTSLTLDPAADGVDADVGSGDGGVDEEHAAGSAEPGTEESSFSGPGWDRMKAAANAGAAAMGFAIRHAPHREAPAGSHPGGPPDHPPTSRDADWPGPPGPDEPVSPQIIALLYEAGLRNSAFDAELRTWADATTAAAAFRNMTSNANLAGVNRLADALTQRATTWQGRESVRIGLPGRYRIDYIDGGKANRKSSSEACDGEQRWRVFPGHVTVGPALPLPSAVARLIDPAWLLEWRLTGGARVVESGRDGYLIRVSRRSPAATVTSQQSVPSEAVVDAELGILLRLSQEQGGRPSMQQSFSDLTTRPRPEPADYRVTIPAGTRVVQDSGTVLDEVELSAPVQTAVQLAVKGLGTAARVGGFLQSLRQQGKDRGA